MKYLIKIATFISIACSLANTHALAESLEEQNIFASKMQQLLREKDYAYARTAMTKYLEIVPDAAPVKRELAHYYMKTKAYRTETLLEFQYPEEDARKIITLLNEAVATNAKDHEAWSLLVYTHALQGNVALGKEALRQANRLEKRAAWLDYNAALLSISDNQLERAVNLLSPIAVKKRLPIGPDKNRIYQNAWFTLKNIAFKEPSLDPLDSIREGFVKRININEVVEYLYAYDKKGPPVVLVISSQDPNCGYCKDDLPVLYDFAKRNEQEGSKYHIVYASTEPWGNIKYYKDALTSLKVSGIPSYNVIHDGFHIYTWGGSKPAALDTLLDEYDRSIRRNVKNKIAVVPRSDYLLDHMYYQFTQYRDATNDGYSAMAFIIDDRFWTVKSSYGHASQNAADDKALALCDAAVVKQGKNLECKLYAQGEAIVDPDALARNIVTRVEKKKAKKKTKTKTQAKPKKKPTPPNNTATSTSVNTSAAIAAAIRGFEKLPDHYKSFAVAGKGDEMVSGMASKELTQYIANEKALANCEKAKLEFSIEYACRLQVIGKAVVEDVSNEAIAKLTARQQKRNAKNSALQASYKKYRKFSTDKAFAYSVGTSGEWVNGMAFGKRGTDKAADAALAECETNRKKKDLPNPCEILILNSKFMEPGQ